MPRPFDETDYERQAKIGALNLLRDFDSEALKTAGDGLRRLKARANSIAGLKSNHPTADWVQSSHKPGSADFRQLEAIECEKAYDGCLATLSDDERELVLAMVMGVVVAGTQHPIPAK
jgi:hypothetical protein